MLAGREGTLLPDDHPRGRNLGGGLLNSAPPRAAQLLDLKRRLKSRYASFLNTMNAWLRILIRPVAVATPGLRP